MFTLANDSYTLLLFVTLKSISGKLNLGHVTLFMNLFESKLG